MNTEDKVRKNQVKSLLYLMLLFLSLSSIANYFNDRISFTILYLFGTILTITIYLNYKKNKDINIISQNIITVLFIIFFSFLFLGEQSSFDIFWVLVLPMIIIIIETYENTKKWLLRFNALLVLSLLASYTNLTIINYDSFALWSLLWAGVFLSYLTHYYKKTQVILENEIQDYQKNLEQKVEIATKEIVELNTDLEATQKEILQRLGTLGEFRSNETGAHVIRVGLYSKELALLYGLDEEYAEQLNISAPLHDIGKVGIEDSILNKPAKLTEQEYEIMKNHALIGESILKDSNKPLINMACEIAGSHHEKYDGSGYPKGLVGEDIPLSARMVAIADVFDALYSKRVYKKRWSIKEIQEHFIKNSGLHFDPVLTKLFLDNFDNFTKIYDENQ